MRNREFVVSPEGEIEEKWNRTEEDKEKEIKGFRKSVDFGFDVDKKQSKELIYEGHMVLSPGGKFDKKLSWSGDLEYYCSWINTPNDLYSFFREFSEHNPDLDVSFKNDPEGKWIGFNIKPKNEK